MTDLPCSVCAMRERLVALEKRIEEVMMTPVERTEQNISVKQALAADLYTKRVTVEPGYNDRVLAAYGVANAELVRLEPRKEDDANGIRGNNNRAADEWETISWVSHLPATGLTINPAKGVVIAPAVLKE